MNLKINHLSVICQLVWDNNVFFLFLLLCSSYLNLVFRRSRKILKIVLDKEKDSSVHLSVSIKYNWLIRYSSLCMYNLMQNVIPVRYNLRYREKAEKDWHFASIGHTSFNHKHTSYRYKPWSTNLFLTTVVNNYILITLFYRNLI